MGARGDDFVVLDTEADGPVGCEDVEDTRPPALSGIQRGTSHRDQPPHMAQREGGEGEENEGRVEELRDTGPGTLVEHGVIEKGGENQFDRPNAFDCIATKTCGRWAISFHCNNTNCVPWGPGFGWRLSVRRQHRNT